MSKCRPVEDTDCDAHAGVDQHVDPGNCKQFSEEEEEASQLGSEPLCQGSEPDEDPRRSEEEMQGLEDSDVESLQGDDVDEDDEEAMLEAAIMQERRAQRLLTGRSSRISMARYQNGLGARTPCMSTNHVSLQQKGLEETSSVMGKQSKVKMKPSVQMSLTLTMKMELCLWRR